MRHTKTLGEKIIDLYKDGDTNGSFMLYLSSKLKPNPLIVAKMRAEFVSPAKKKK